MPDIDQDTTVPLVGPNQGLSLRNWKYLVQGLLQDTNKLILTLGAVLGFLYENEK